MTRMLRVPFDGLVSGIVELPDELARYVVRVHRCRAGERLQLFDASRGLEAEAVLISERPARVEVGLVERAIDPAMQVTLLQGLGKGEKPEQALRDATVLGAARVTFVKTVRSVARAEGQERPERLERVMREAARQSGRSGVPEVSGPISLAAALAEFRDREDTCRLVASVGPGARPLFDVLLDADRLRSPAQDRFAVLIGPEGGFSPEEMDDAIAHSFLPVSLGPLVLRTETAATAVLGALRLFLDRTRS